MKKGKVLIIADPVVDLYMRIAKLEKMLMSSASPESELYAGGTGGNTAGALARMGVNVALWGAVGSDTFGKFFKNELANIGVDATPIVELEKAPTLLCSVAVARSGERYFSVYPAQGYAAGLLENKHRQDNFLSGITWLHVSGSCLSEIPARYTLLDSMRIASETGLPISLDLNLRPREDAMPKDYLDAVEEAIEYTDYVLGSAEEEYFPLTGIRVPEEAAQKLSAGKRTVVTRLGAEGSLAITPDGEKHYAPAFKVDVVDTLGAGDVYDAGFITACLEGQNVDNALRWGNALAALSISLEGAYRELDRIEFSEMLGI